MKNEEDLKTWYVGIASPYYKDGYSWTATTIFDMLSADALATLDGKKVLIETIEAQTAKEAIKEFKDLHPEFKNHFEQMDKEDIEISW